MNDAVIAARVVMCFLALLQVILGACALKTKPNALIGMRLPWTIKNDKIWGISQKIMFITSITTSIGIIITSFMITESFILIFILGISLLLTNVLIGSIVTYFLSKRKEYNL